MSTVYRHIEDSLYDYIAPLLTPYPVIISDEGGTEPTSSYLSLRVIDVEEQGQSYRPTFVVDIDPPPEQGITTVTTDTKHYISLVRLQAVGSKSHEIISRIEKSFSRDKERMILSHDHGISIMNVIRTRRTPQKRETSWVESYTLDVQISTLEKDTYTLDYVDVDDVIITSNIQYNGDIV